VALIIGCRAARHRGPRRDRYSPDRASCSARTRIVAASVARDSAFMTCPSALQNKRQPQWSREREASVGSPGVRERRIRRVLGSTHNKSHTSLLNRQHACCHQLVSSVPIAGLLRIRALGRCIDCGYGASTLAIRGALRGAAPVLRRCLFGGTYLCTAFPLYAYRGGGNG
jgi:hypothetical protein